AGDESGMGTLWDVSTRPRPTMIQKVRKHDRRISALVFSPSGNDLAMCGALRVRTGEWFYRMLKVWEVATGRGHGSISIPQSSYSEIIRVSLAPDGKSLAGAFGNPFNVALPGHLKVLDAGALKQLASRSIPNGGAFAAAFSLDGKTLATG